jgi:hypothetical protein
MQAGWVAAAVLIASSGAAAAQDAPSFPTSLERGPLLTWLQRETDIMPDRVLAVTPQAITSVVSTFPAGGGQPARVVIRAESLSPESHMRTGALSWHVSLSADCSNRQIRLGETTGYPRRNLLGDRQLLRDADPFWRHAEPGTALESAWRLVCERGFAGPFSGGPMRVAKTESPEAPSAAAVAAATPAPRPEISSSQSAGGGAYAVQIGASPSEAEARALLAAVEAQAAGRETRVETAVVGGRTWRRAVVAGFADAGEAGRFCATLKASGRDCFVRAGR